MTRPPRKEMPVAFGEEGVAVVVVDNRLNVLESVDVMTLEQAQAITDRIRECITAEWELRAQAFLGHVWIPLGYISFDAYLVGEFGPNKLFLPRKDRRAAVAYMRSLSMSIRAIALAAGCDKNTVLSDLAKMKAEASPPDDEAQVSEFQTPGSAITDGSMECLPFIRGLDKKVYPPPRRGTAAERRAEKTASKRCNGLADIYSNSIDVYRDQLALQTQIDTWKTTWGRTSSNDERNQMLCIADQLANTQNLTKEMQSALDEILDASPTLLDDAGAP